MGYIYKITNKVNSKVYIGQTSRSIEIRWQEHLRHAFEPNISGYNNHFYKAVRKYGADNFIIELVEQCDNDIMSEREIFWIDFYNSYNSEYGYNLTRGGEGTRSINYEEVYSRYDSGESLAEISKNMDISRSNLTQILKGYKRYNVDMNIMRGYQYMSKTKGTPVCQYDLFGNLIDIFPSSKAAARAVPKTTHANISKVCKTKNGLSGGFQWRFLNDPEPGKYVGPAPNISKTVYQFDLSYQLINVFKSTCSASFETGVNQSSIVRCCNNDERYPTAGGYIWRYEKNLKECA